jgi:hypothetical protein
MLIDSNGWLESTTTAILYRASLEGAVASFPFSPCWTRCRLRTNPGRYGIETELCQSIILRSLPSSLAFYDCPLGGVAAKRKIVSSRY